MQQRFTVKTSHMGLHVNDVDRKGKQREFSGTSTRTSVQLLDRMSPVADFDIGNVALADRIALLLNNDEANRADDAYREQLQQKRNQ